MAVFSSTKISLLFLFLFLSVSSSPFVNGDTTPHSVNCSPLILDLREKCMAFVSIGSRVNRPEAWCCIGVMAVMRTDCLCEWYYNIGSMDRLVNVTKAASLPYACNFVAPPMDSCEVSPPPPSAPAPVPSAGPGRQGSIPVPSPSQRNMSGSGPSGSAAAPRSSQKNHGFSLIPVSTLSYVITGALVIFCFI